MGVKRFGGVLERYAHAALDDAPADGATFVIDGNNLAHVLARGAGAYDDVDAAARDFLEGLSPHPVVAFFDGPRADASGDRDGELARRARLRGDAASRRLYEGVDARSVGVLAVEQCRATLLAALGPQRCVACAGEADDAIRAFCAANDAVVYSDDADFLIAGCRVARFRDGGGGGRAWSRRALVDAIFGAAAREDALVEVALCLGTDALAPSCASPEEAVAVVARGLSRDPAWVLESGAADDGGLLERTRRAYLGAPPPVGLRSLGNDDHRLEEHILADVCDGIGLAPAYRRALARVVDGERGASESPPPAEDVEAAYAYERAIRDELRAHQRFPETLMPFELFDAASFFAFVAQERASPPASTSPFSAAAPAFEPPGAFSAAAPAFEPAASPTSELEFARDFGSLDAGAADWTRSPAPRSP